MGQQADVGGRALCTLWMSPLLATGLGEAQLSCIVARFVKPRWFFLEFFGGCASGGRQGSSLRSRRQWNIHFLAGGRPTTSCRESQETRRLSAVHAEFADKSH